MSKSFSFHADPSEILRTKIRQAIVLMAVGGFLYPAWALIHFMVYKEAQDSFWERFAVYGVFLVLIGVAKISNLSLEKKLLVLQSNRWILIAHYFTIVGRNHIAFQYAIAAYFLVFILSSLFETPKYFVLYSLFVLGLSLGCTTTNLEFPAYSFQLGLATCLLISFFGMVNRYKLLTALKESESAFRTMFETAGVGMAVVSLQGQITAVNKTLLSMLNLSLEEMQNRNFDFLSADSQTEDFRSAIQELASGGKTSVKFEHRLVSRSPFDIWAKISASIIKNGNDSLFVLAMIENISEQKEAETVIEMQKEKMNYSSKMTAIGEMAGGIAHEINTPLSIIGMSATLIKDSIAKGETRMDLIAKSVSRIEGTVQRIAKVIQGLRKFSRDGSAELMVSVSVKTVVQDTMDLCNETLNAAGINMSIEDIPEDLCIQCRPVEISQVLLNLINNAHDAIKSLTGEKWIRISFTHSTEFVRISVTNNGPPISKEVQAKIFQPFFTTKPVGQGTGLGLSISMGIMTSHHGSLTVDPESPHTRFVMKVCRIAQSMEQRSAA